MTTPADKPALLGADDNHGLVSAEDYSNFLAERQTCLGGSDAHHLLGVDPFGCKRWLFWNKVGVVPDFPFDGNRHTRRGLLLEDVAAQEFARLTGCGLRKPPFLRLEAYPHLGAHVDRLQLTMAAETVGVLEIKVPAYFAFRQVGKVGMSEAYALQAQWGMMIHALPRADVWLWSAEEMRGYRFPLLADWDLHEQFVRVAEEFWPRVVEARDAGTADVENPYPGPADARDRRCKGCEYRWRCLGIGRADVSATSDEELIELQQVECVVDGTLDELAREWREAKAEAKAVDWKVTEIEEALKTKLAALGEGKGIAGNAGARAFFTSYVRHEKAREARTQTIYRLRVIPPPEDGPFEAPE